MSEEIKALVGSQKRLQELLGCGRVQAWRVWNGKSKLTKSNERLIRISVGVLK